MRFLQRRILVAGVGNVFFGDDAFGVEVAQRLATRHWPDGVEVADYGIRSFDLAFRVAEGWDAFVLLDVARRGAPPGTVHVLDPELPDRYGAHRITSLVRRLGADLPLTRILACEPAHRGDEGIVGLSPQVSAAVGAAIAIVERLITSFVTEPSVAASSLGDALSA